MTKLDCIKNDFSFIFNPTKETVAEFVAKTKTAIANPHFSHKRDYVIGGKHNDIYYSVLVRFRNTYVNKSLVSPYESDFESDYAEFPKWGAICVNRKEPERLYFGVFYENCSPNWNHESKCVKLIPLDEITEPIVTDWKGITRIDECVVETLFNARQKRIGEDLPNYGEQPNKEQLRHLIELGMLCTYRRGWAYRGAVASPITKEEALAKLDVHSYGKGFHSLSYSVKDNVPRLEFNELSELDME